MKTIAIISNFDKTQAVCLLTKVIEFAKQLGFKIWLKDDQQSADFECNRCAVNEFVTNGVEAVVVLGGDGTMLDAAHQMDSLKLPMMGLNIGSLGYLTSVEDHEYQEALRHLYEGSFTVNHRTALSIVIERANGTLCCMPDAWNDAVITRGATGHAVKLELILDGLAVSEFICDGIIVATPTGSTAYSLSAGGPIVMPTSSVFVVSLICPHSLTSRPLVLRDSSEIVVRVVECGSSMLVSSDGRRDMMVNNGDRIKINRSSQLVPLIELHGYNPYEVLRRKLSWGGREHGSSR